jgi:hypothetical protein
MLRGPSRGVKLRLSHARQADTEVLVLDGGLSPLWGLTLGR